MAAASTGELEKVAFSYLTVSHNASGMQTLGSRIDPSNLFLLTPASNSEEI